MFNGQHNTPSRLYWHIRRVWVQDLDSPATLCFSAFLPTASAVAWFLSLFMTFTTPCVPISQHGVPSAVNLSLPQNTNFVLKRTKVYGYSLMCVKKLLVCWFKWNEILKYIVINVNSSVVSAINHLLIRLKWFQWFIDIWSVHISGLCVLKISVCCRCVIKSVKIGFCSTRSVVSNVRIIGHNIATISCCET